jgi:hypothetical protein
LNCGEDIGKGGGVSRHSAQQATGKFLLDSSMKEDIMGCTAVQTETNVELAASFVLGDCDRYRRYTF